MQLSNKSFVVKGILQLIGISQLLFNLIVLSALFV